MSLPRQILPDSMYLVTRRCTQRQFLLRPSATNTTIFMYCLALAAEKTGVLVHAVCVLSNHYHATVTDPLGRVPDFMQHLHKYVSKCVNASYGRWENLWSAEQPSLVRCEEDDDVLRRMVYTLTNPIEAYLVDCGRHWPGVRMAPEDLLNGPIACPRPNVFFSKEGNTPEVAYLKLTRPDIYPHLSDEEFVQLLSGAVEAREEELRAEAKRKHIRFLGARKVLAQRPTDSPSTIPPRRNLSPRIAAANKWRRIEAIRRLKSFAAEYRLAWLEWKRGLRDILFPPGTYALVHHAGAACRAP